MSNLSDKAIKIINTIIIYMKESDADLSDIEGITDIIEGEFDENYPNLHIVRSDIRSYVKQFLH